MLSLSGPVVREGEHVTAFSTHTPFKPHPVLLPPTPPTPACLSSSSLTSPHAQPYHPVNRFKIEKFFPLQATKFFTSSRPFSRFRVTKPLCTAGTVLLSLRNINTTRFKRFNNVIHIVYSNAFLKLLSL